MLLFARRLNVSLHCAREIMALEKTLIMLFDIFCIEIKKLDFKNQLLLLRLLIIQ
jgi:hypothetical protein